ncbi:MAG: rod shape-determining protein MreC [Thermodesulfobacteriota bacterium]
MTAFLRRHQVILSATVLCLFSLHLTVTEKKGVGGAVLVKGVLAGLTSPLQSALLGVRSFVEDTWSGYLYLVGLREENETLKETVHALNEENNSLREELRLSAGLNYLMGFKRDYSLTTLPADTLGFSAFEAGGGWTRTATLGKGADHGIGANMPVVRPEGVAGRVIAVTAGTSTVLLLTDPRSNIDVILQRTRVKGVAQGDGSGGIILKYLRELEDVRVGDRVVTAGLAGVFPKGLLVGEVTRVEKGGDNFFSRVEVRPYVGLSKIEEVLVVTEDPHPR